ncbi:hypothetical protein AKJ45_00240 [candidate division MSBL1 archaeon SCGC-AAA261F19]|uniref:Uncharacterized protein n=1 Tax=candidate division MSBL1 archaeon SCGC-AAA261F19 TaxID=1698275 RepID=A0A133VBP1_9EURY|nr:hypothetical protein AKJ45_00240 [candidate division MSBL1 archaeon SCGC-AAA261F19]
MERAEGRNFALAANYVQRIREKLLTFAEPRCVETAFPTPTARWRGNSGRMCIEPRGSAEAGPTIGLLNVSLRQLSSRLEEDLFRKFKEVYIGEAGMLNFSASLPGG